MSSDRRRRSLLLAVLVFVSCTGDGDGAPSGAADDDASSGGQRHAGTLVVGIDAEPVCADWISTCVGSAQAADAGTWTMAAATMPSAFVLDPARGNLTPSALLDGPPEVDDLPEGMRITYDIAADAVWSDGEPITSADFAYTWQQIVSGTDTASDAGYREIVEVDASADKTTIVTLREDLASWPTLFSLPYGIHPAHLLEDTDRHAAMADGYDWSGGPWRIERWTPGAEVALVENERWWGTRPTFERVEVRFFADADAAGAALAAGDVDALSLRPNATQVIEELQRGGAGVVVRDSLVVEALWFNTSETPLDDLLVRKALVHALDREAIASALFGAIDPGIEPIHSFGSPALGASYTDPYRELGHDLSVVESLMARAGYERAPTPDATWTRDGEPLVLELTTTAGEARRQRAMEIISNQWQEGGFGVSVAPVDATELFGERLPGGAFTVGLYAVAPTSADPGLCWQFCSFQIPTSGAGRNWTRLEDDTVDGLLIGVDIAIDPVERLDLLAQAQQTIADLAPGAPLYALPMVLVLGDTIDADSVVPSAVEGPFANLHEWRCTTERDGGTGESGC